MNQEEPLSRSGGRKKIEVAGPVAVICAGIAIFLPDFRSWGMVGFAIFGAYAGVGILELTAGDALSAASAKWDALKGWQRGLVGFAVIIVFLALSLALMPLVAELIYQ